MKKCLFLLLLIPAFLNAQQASEDSASRGFSTDLFIHNLNRIFNDSVSGWGYEINYKNFHFSKYGGFARAAKDNSGKAIPFSVSTRMHIASASKTLTGVAAYKLFKEKNISLDSRIIEYLPPSWAVDTSYQLTSVKDLLLMRAGLNQPLNAESSSFDSLRETLSHPADASKKGHFFYQNVNYGLLRLIIGRLALPKDAPSNDLENDSKLTAAYMNYINDNLLKPSGIPPAVCRDLSSQAVFMYPYPFTGQKGIPTAFNGTGQLDLAPFSGGLGWFLSAADLSAFIKTLFFSNRILNQQDLPEFKQLGFPVRKVQTKKGALLYSGGDWRYNPDDQKYTCGIQTSYYVMPNGLMIILFNNSAFNHRRKLIEAYESSFQKESSL